MPLAYFGIGPVELIILLAGLATCIVLPVAVVLVVFVVLPRGKTLQQADQGPPPLPTAKR